MASTSLKLLITFTIFLFLINLLFLQSQATSPPPRQYSHNKTSSPAEFLNHLEGCKKGDRVEGINKVKKYLKHYGYLTYPKRNNSHANDDTFGELLERAIKTYQKNHNLNVTGTLDPRTLTQISKPRCGVSDIVNGTTRMNSGKKKHHHSHSFFHTVSHYAFFPGYPRWSPSQYDLTYKFLLGTPSEAMDAVSNAFNTWAANTKFTFSSVDENSDSDIQIGFFRGDHGDNHPFDGPGRILAHAFAPTDGRFHYDADENWSVGAVQGAYDYESIAVHEIGHLLGLGHSSVRSAIMWPYSESGVTKLDLDADDISGIHALYNA